MIWRAFFLVLVFQTSSQAEYRAFLLKISTTTQRNPAQDPADQSVNALEQGAAPPVQDRYIRSNLDPNQYLGYFPLKENETISYTDTWMCPGRTGNFRQICKSPREIAASQPAAPPDSTSTDPQAPTPAAQDSGPLTSP